jgi:hypothetical protein
MELNEDLKELEQVLQQVNEMDRQLTMLQSTVNQRAKDVVRRLTEGETTGDVLKDAILVGSHGRPSEAFEKAYRLIQDKLVGKKGQMVVVIRREENFSGCSGFGRHTPSADEYVLEEHFWAGILTGEALILDPVKHLCDLPVEKHALCWDPFSRDKTITIHNETIHLGIEFPLWLDKKLERKNPWGRRPHGLPLHLEVKIGDEEAKQWFLLVDKQVDDLYGQVAESLGQLVLRP